MKVIFLPDVRRHFENLIPILYERGYFGYKETAQKYVTDLFDDIENNLHIQVCVNLHKPAPNYFDKYGENMEYTVFKKSKHTSWYVFFETYMENGEIVYLVRYIANNHIIAHYL